MREYFNLIINQDGDMGTTRKEFILKSLTAAAGASSIFGTSVFEKLSQHKGSAKSIKVAIFSKHLEWLDYKPMAETAARLGFDGVDLTVRPGGHVLPENVTMDLPRAVQAVRDAGMEVLMISTAIGGLDQQHTKPILNTASDLGITNYRTDWYTYDDTISFEQNLEQFKERLIRLAELNEKLGIQGDYQNHSGSGFGASILDLWMVLQEIGSEWLGAQYDIRHATVEGAESWPVGFKAIHPHIGTLDIKDFHWTKREGFWQVQNVPLGEGQVDFDRYFRLLKEYGVTAPMSVHYEYPLGGANHGDTTLTIPEDEVLAALKRDLETLCGWLSEHGLR